MQTYSSIFTQFFQGTKRLGKVTELKGIQIINNVHCIKFMLQNNEKANIKKDIQYINQIKYDSIAEDYG